MRERSLAHRPDRVDRESNQIIFRGRFRAAALDFFVLAVSDALHKGYTDLVFDFSETTRVWPDTMVPVLAFADWMRANQGSITLRLPRTPEIRKLFSNTCWAHYLDPIRFSASDVNIEHFNARRFADAQDQQRVVTEVMRLVVAKLRPSNDTLTALEWCVNEITDNVLTHAESCNGGIVQLACVQNQIIFCVADSGRGILASMREGHGHLRNDTQAIEEAVKAGVTRDPTIGQGNGLAGTLNVARLSGGRFTIMSRRGRLLVSKVGTKHPLKSWDAEFPGTVVTATIRTDREIDLEEALGFGGRATALMNVLDYHDEAGDSIVLHLRQETAGVGSRPAGAFLREKCMHLLTEEPAKKLILDWTGVPVISSSFADEALGKLFVALGPLQFGARVRHKNLERVNQGLVDKAILQRAAQHSKQSMVKPSPKKRRNRRRNRPKRRE